MYVPYLTIPYHEEAFEQVTVTVTKVFILCFLLKDRKCITESFRYIFSEAPVK